MPWYSRALTRGTCDEKGPHSLGICPKLGCGAAPPMRIGVGSARPIRPCSHLTPKCQTRAQKGKLQRLADFVCSLWPPWPVCGGKLRWLCAGAQHGAGHGQSYRIPKFRRCPKAWTGPASILVLCGAVVLRLRVEDLAVQAARRFCEIIC